MLQLWVMLKSSNNTQAQHCWACYTAPSLSSCTAWISPFTISTEFNDICTNYCTSSTKCQVRNISTTHIHQMAQEHTTFTTQFCQKLQQYTGSTSTCSHVHENRLALLQASKAEQHMICCDVVHWDGSSFFICHAFGQQSTQISW